VAEGRGVAGFQQDRGEQLVARPLTTAVQLLPAEQPTQAAQADRVALPQRGEDEVDGAVRLDPVVGVLRDLEDDVEERQEWTHGHLVADRALTRRGEHRHAVGHEDPAQRLVAALAADDHRHLAPGDPIEEVCLTQSGGDVGGLLGRRPQERDLDGTVVADRPRPSVPAAAEGADPGRDGPAHLGERLRLPVCGRQHHRRWLARGGVGAAQRGPTVCEEARVGAPEGLDRGVRVADQDKVGTGRGEDAQQPGRGEGQLLGVVDDDEPHLLAYPRERRRVVLEQVGRRRENPRGVVGARPGERSDLVVLAEHLRGGDPLRSGVLHPERGEPVGLDPVLDGAHQQVAQLGPEAALVEGDEDRLGPGRAGRVAAGVPGEQLAEDDVLLGSADQAGRLVAAQRRLPAQDPEPERLVGARERLGRGAGQPRGDPLAQPAGGHAGRGQQQALVRREAAALDPVDDELDGGRGLAGARRAEHADQRAASVEHGLLPVVEAGRVDDEGRGSSQEDHVVIPPREGDTDRSGGSVPARPAQVDAQAFQGPADHRGPLLAVVVPSALLQPARRPPAGPDDPPPGHVGPVPAHDVADEPGAPAPDELRDVPVREHLALGDLVDDLQDLLGLLRQLGHRGDVGVGHGPDPAR
jgi:hypothetical protein